MQFVSLQFILLLCRFQVNWLKERKKPQCAVGGTQTMNHNIHSHSPSWDDLALFECHSHSGNPGAAWLLPAEAREAGLVMGRAQARARKPGLGQQF